MSLLAAAGALHAPLLCAADEHSVASADDLKEYLSKQKSETDKTYYDNATLTLTDNISVETILPGTDDSGNTTFSSGTISVLANGVKILGEGKTISSREYDESDSGSGDIFFIAGTTLSVENITFSATTTTEGFSKKTGRVFTTQNGTTASTLNLGNKTKFENRVLVADASTNYAARGGAIVSASVLDSVSVEGTVSFSGNVAAATGSSDADSTTLVNAFGGAVYTSGLFSVASDAMLTFSKNVANSASGAASGGAIFVGNATLNANGTSSSTKYPDSFSGDLSSKKFGLQIAGATVSFKENSVVGQSASGGAIAVSGGYFDATDSAEISFEKNSASNLETASAGSSLGGGALLVCDSGRATFASGTTLDFSQNKLTANADLTRASGGALAVTDATFSASGTTTFTGNSATSEKDGATLSGGAAYFYGTIEETKNSDGTTTKSHTTNVTLSGDLSFTDNFVSASGLAKTTTVESSASGGAIAVYGGKIDGSALTALSFSGNYAQAKTTASGGALAVLSDDAEISFAASSAEPISFSGNNALTLALVEGETQTDGVSATAQGGAIYQTAGTLTLGATTFESNVASSPAGIGQGGAIFSRGGTITFSDAAKFSSNRVEGGTSNETGTNYARGGAIFSDGGAITFSGDATFSGGHASVYGATQTDRKRSIASGGAIYQASGTIAISGTADFSENNATSLTDGNGVAQGGAVYVADDFSAGKISATENYTSAESSSATATLSQGGAIFAESAAMVSVAGDVSLTGNYATAQGAGEAQGGAIYLAGTMSVGGTFSASENSVGKISSTVTTAQGGAVYIAGGSLEISGDGAHVFSGNKAADATTAQGGAIYISGGTFSTTAGTLEISENSVSGETAQGGAIFLRGGNVSLADATISGNTATGTTASGGAIYIDASKAATLTFSGNTTISGNTANAASDGIAIGSGKETISIEFSSGEGETATVDDKISVAGGASLSLKKTGAGELTLSEIAGSSAESEKISLEFDAGTTTLGGAISGTISEFTVASGATVSLGAELTAASTATIAGTLNVGAGGVFNFSSDAKTTVSGTLAFEKAKAKISGAATVDGTGTFSVKASTFSFEDSATLTAATLSVGAGTLALETSGTTATLYVTDSLVFTETGAAEISLGDGTTLALKKVARTADGVNATISGDGTLMLYGEATTGSRVDFSEFYETTKDASGNETKTLTTGTFSVENTVEISTGISVGEGVSFSLDPASQEDGSKNILLDGGTLTTTENATLEMETFSVTDSENGSKLGDGETTQTFEMAATTTTGDDGQETTTANASISGALEITANTTFVGDVAFSSGGKISGAGTLDGSILSGTGTVSVAKVSGNISAKNGSTITLAGAVSVGGDVDVGTADLNANANFVLSSGASLSLTSGTFSNYGNTKTTGDATISGTFHNGGTIVVGENSTLTFSGNFTNSLSDGTNVLAGTIDLSAAGSAVVFSDAASVVINDGKIVVSATTLPADSALPISGLTANHFKNLKIVDSAGNDLSSRFELDSDGTLKFLGLNGTAFAGTIYGDWQRESVNRTHEFLRAAIFRGNARAITPEIYGVGKLNSPYMRGYLEKMRQRGGEVSAEVEARRAKDLARAEKLNSPLKNAWVQADVSTRERSSDGSFEAYDTTTAGILTGFSLPLGTNWELGWTISGAQEKYETSGAATRHKITTDAYGLAAYTRYKNSWFDWTTGAAGAFDSSDSDRGEYSGSFDGWRLGAMTEFGATLRVRSAVALRAFVGASLAYSRMDSFDESGPGKAALSIDAEGAFGARTNLGFSSSFAVTDALQFGVRLAWLLDLGKDSYSLDARMPGTRTDYVIDSRDNSSSALDAGAFFNWAIADSVELFGGYTGTFRSGETAHGFTLGVNCFF